MTSRDGPPFNPHAGDYAKQVNIVGSDVGTVIVGSSESTFDRLRAKIVNSITSQSNALTNLGLLRVPWVHEPSSAPGPEEAPRPDLGDADALVRFVADGGRLLILGDSQSGKTTLATLLAMRLGASTEKLPVIFPLARWYAERVRLTTWMIDVIREDYDVRDDRLEAAQDALDRGGIIPIFDGFDEIEAGRREVAAPAIAQFSRNRSVILTSIPVGTGASAPRAALRQAEVITLAPVAPSEVGRYLLHDVQAADRAQWEDVVRRVTSDAGSALSIALSSPLMTWLAKTVYSEPASKMSPTPHPSPIELLRTDRFATSTAVEEHLLGGLIRSVFARRATSPDDPESPAEAFSFRDAERWLHYLSRQADRGIIAFWEIRRYAPLNRLAVLPAAATGAVIGFAGHAAPQSVGPSFFHLWAGLFFGFGFARGYATGRTTDVDDGSRPGFELDAAQRERLARSHRPAARARIQKDGGLRHHATRLLASLPFVAISYASCLLTAPAGDDQPVWRFGQRPLDFWTGLALAFLVAPTVGFLGALVAARYLRANSRLDASTGARATDPLVAISGDRRSGIGILILATLTLGAGYLLYDAVLLPHEAIWGLLAAPAGALVAMLYWNVWARYKAAHVWLACWDRLPWRLVTFLQVCHKGGILRKRGNYFEFRHQRLRRRLAEMEPHAR